MSTENTNRVDIPHEYAHVEDMHPRDKPEYQERLLAWILLHGEGAFDVPIGAGTSEAGFEAYRLYWKGLLGRRVNSAALVTEFRINQAGLDLLKEDL